MNILKRLDPRSLLRVVVSWIAGARLTLRRITTSIASQVTPSDWLHLSLFAAFGLFLFIYMTIQQDIDATGIALLFSFIGWSLVATRKRWDWAVWVVLIAVVVAVGPSLAFDNWDVLHDDDKDSVITTIRNLALIIGGIIAVLLAIWRSKVAETQADTAQQSLLNSQKSLLNERYQRSAEMLGNAVLSVRIGGIYTLQRLAEDHPEEYHLQIMTLLCAFVRHPIEDKSLMSKHPSDDSGSPIRPDIKVAMDAISSRGEQSVVLETEAGFTVDLSKAELGGTEFAHARLANAVLRETSLFDTKLRNADLSNSDITCANLSSANLWRANLYGADFTNSKMLSARLIHADLTNACLDETRLAEADFRRAIMHYAELNRAKMRCANLIDAQLPGASFTDAELPDAKLIGTDLSDALLVGTNLSGASLGAANLSGASLSGANLSGANLSDSDSGSRSPVTGLTQAQLDEACADPDNPPKLDGVLDAKTDKPLVWYGKPCEE